MQIINLQGQIMFSELYAGKSERFVKQVNISGYPAGVYIIKVRCNNITKTGKFVIKY
jgi:hypothetical protein